MKTSDLARRAGVKVETVIFYEKSGLMVPPPRIGANYRSYSQSDLVRLTFIRRARNLGFDLGAVRELLKLSDDKDQSCAAIDNIAKEQLRAVKQKIAELQALQTELKNVIGQCKSGIVSDCAIVEALGNV